MLVRGYLVLHVPYAIDVLRIRGVIMGAIIDFFKTLFDFVTTLLDGVIWAITNIPTMANSFISVFAYAPPFLSVFLTLCLTVTITYAVLKLV